MIETKLQDHWIGSALHQFEGPLIRYAMTFTRDLGLAQDVVQDAFLKLLKEDRNKVADHLAPWLFKVCRNRALEILRKDKRMTFTSDTLTTDSPSREHDPARQTADREMTEKMFQMLLTLPENQQEVVRLKFQNGMSYKEISSITNLSVSNVGYLLHQAVKSLRHALRGPFDLAPETGRSLS